MLKVKQVALRQHSKSFEVPCAWLQDHLLCKTFTGHWRGKATRDQGSDNKGHNASTLQGYSVII